MLPFDSSSLHLWGSEILLKVTILYSIGFLAAWSLRRHSSSARHHVWMLTSVGALVVPIIICLAPQWKILPGWLDFSVPTGSSPSLAIDQLTTKAAATSDSTTPASRTQATIGFAQLDVMTALLTIWLIGCVIGIVRMIAGIVSLYRLQHLATTLKSGQLYRRIVECSDELNLRCPKVLITTDRRMPMTWGVFRPLLLLPSQVNQWSVARQQAAILHELAHIRRRDPLLQLVIEFARIVYWFHPIVWLAVRQIRLDREQACDDIVLSCRGKASDYAEHLVCIAASCKRLMMESCTAVAMAGQSILERRVRSILDEARPRHRLSTKTSRLAVVGFVVLAATLGLVQGNREQQTTQNNPDESLTSPQDTSGLTSNEMQSLADITSLGGRYQLKVEDGRSRVTEVAIHNRSLRDDQLTLLRPLTDLTRLDLSNSLITDRAMEFVRELHQLESLSLNGTAVTDRGFSRVSVLSNLRQVKLADTKVTSEGIQILQSLPQLEDLQLSGQSIDSTSSHLLASLPRLKSLALSGDRVNNHTLMQIGSLQELKALSLAGSHVDDHGLAHLHTFANLETLEISRSRVEGTGLGHLRKLEKLNTLILGGNQMNLGVDQLKRMSGVQRIIADDTITPAGPWVKHALVLSNSRVAS